MGSEWPTVQLEQIATVIDSRHKTPEYCDHGYPMVRVVDVKGGELTLEETKRVSEDVYIDFSKGRDPEIGDLIISRVGSYGNVSFVSSNDKFCLGQNTALIIPEDKNRFLYYALTSPQLKRQIDDMAVGAVQKTISLKSIKGLEIPQPPIAIREKISSYLSALDNKITLNRQINQTLEQMAQTLFKSWFVDFDPVIDNALDAGNPIPDELQHRAEARNTVRESEGFKPLPDDVRQLFPDAFEESELGWVPKGWVITRLENILELAYGKALTKTDRVDGKYPVYGSGGVNGTHKTYLVKGPGIIVGRKGTVGSLHWERNNFFPIDTVFYVKPHIGYSLTYCFYLLKTLGLETMNTDAAVPGLNRNNAYRLKCVIPSEEVREHLTKTLTDGRKKMDACLENIETLSKLRDELLPKLISGDIKIGDSF